MSQCPKCNNSIEIQPENFGTLYKCARCQQEFFVGFDGVPEGAQDFPAENNSVENINNSSDLNINQIPTSLVETDSKEMNDSFSSMEVDQNSIPDQISSEQPNYNENTVDQSVQPIDSNSMAYHNEGPINSDNDGISSFLNNDINNDSQPFQMGESFNNQNKTNFFQDIQDFGNQNLNSNEVLYYDIVIKGLDLPETVRGFFDEISEGRLGLNIDEMKSQINNGELSIKQLSSAKAIVIINRLQYLPLEINWRQNATNI